MSNVDYVLGDFVLGDFVLGDLVLDSFCRNYILSKLGFTNTENNLMIHFYVQFLIKAAKNLTKIVTHMQINGSTNSFPAITLWGGK